MKNKRILFPVILFLAGIMACNAQFPISIKQVLDPSKSGLTEKDAAAGIREALVKGTGESVKIVSKVNGYFANPEIKIPFPQEAKDIETKLRAIGLGSQVDEVVTSLNRAAEDAAKSAEPVFVSAINGMSISDAINIVKGSNDAATSYLKKTTSPELKEKFTPIIKTSLDKVDATRLWTDLIKQYNQIPFVKKQNPDLAAYVTDKAITGLFVMVAKEEGKIRKDPAARATELLKKVFGN
ncbi:MAG: DUF4197 domain-containing protein [Bacteroidetes bacterium]|nr:DUF4197 domain-containing protein [Bacteroidota bacterium]